MTTFPVTGTTTPTAENQFDKGGLAETKIDDFLKLMIAELQNQDPLDPMENSEMLQQLSQMRAIGATDKLTSTLDSVLMGQNITTASTMIGKQISALSDSGENIEGTVDRVTVSAADDQEGANVRIHVGDQSVALKNVREILPAAAE